MIDNPMVPSVPPSVGGASGHEENGYLLTLFFLLQEKGYGEYKIV